MRKHGFRWWFAVLAILALVAAACGDDDDSGGDDGGDDTEDTTEGDTEADGEAMAEGEGSIWVLLPDSASSDRWEKDDRRFFKEGFEAAGLSEGDDFTIVNAEGDSETQISQAEQAIADGASVIVLTSLDAGSGATIIENAQAEGVQVVEYDRFNPDSPGGEVYVSFDNVKVGATMAEVLDPLIDEIDSPDVVLLNGGETDNNSFLFKEGYAATAEERDAAGEWNIVADQHVPEWDNAEALTIFEQILVDNNNEVDAVFAANDGLASSVISALESAGLDPTTIPLSGQDATQAGIQNVLLGKQSMSVYKPIQAEADAAVQAALALRAGEDPAALTGEWSVIGINADGSPADSPEGEGVVAYIALTPVAVTADNVADTVIADGFRTVEELCTGDVSDTDFCQENA